MLEIVHEGRVPFSEVPVGAIFTFCGDGEFLKINHSDYTDEDGYYKNAVGLSYFELVTFYDDDMVTVCPRAKLIVP